MCEKAASIAELEREIGACEAAVLTPTGQEYLKACRAELAQLRTPALTQGEGSEPVGWQWRRKFVGEWSDWMSCNSDWAAGRGNDEHCEVRPLYASPPPLPAGNADPAIPQGVRTALNNATLSKCEDEVILICNSGEEADRLFGFLIALAQSDTTGNADPRVREAACRALCKVWRSPLPLGSQEVRRGMSEILERLTDLHKQATVERSHYYVGKCVRDAISTIAELEKRIGELEAERDALKRGAEAWRPMTEGLELALTAERQRRESAEAALRTIYDGTMEYIKINNLAGAENNHDLKQARAHFALYPTPQEQTP